MSGMPQNNNQLRKVEQNKKRNKQEMLGTLYQPIYQNTRILNDQILISVSVLKKNITMTLVQSQWIDPQLL